MNEPANVGDLLFVTKVLTVMMLIGFGAVILLICDIKDQLTKTNKKKKD